MLFRKDNFISNDTKPLYIEQVSDPTSLFIKPVPVEVPTPQPVIKPIAQPFIKPIPIFVKPEIVEVPTPQPVVKPLFVKPDPLPVEVPTPLFVKDIELKEEIEKVLPVEPEPIHIPNSFEIQQTVEKVSEQTALFTEPVKTKIIETKTENEDINMVNDCTKHYTGENSYFDPKPDPKPDPITKKPILPFEHKPFGLMRIIVGILIVYIIFLKK